VGYMSPEQASGMQLDFRSDQFSLGSILYEMATGKRAFQKKTPIDTLAAILNEDPEAIGAINPQVPAPLRWIVERCLSKEPEYRYASTKDLARELAGLRDHLSEASISGAALAGKAVRRRSALVPAALLAAALGGAVVAVAVGRLASRPAEVRFRQLTFSPGTIHTARFAPDGQTIVYGFQRQANNKIEILSTLPGSTESRSLGLPPGDVLSISSSGELALRLSDKTLAQAPLSGGAPREILERVRGADWSPDGKNLVVLHVVGGKSRLEFPIGHLLYETPNNLDNPRLSPKGDLIAFGQGIGRPLWVLDLKGSSRLLAAKVVGFAWAPSGEEVWFGTTMRGVTEVRAARLSGGTRRVVELPGTLNLQDISRSGVLLLEAIEPECHMMGLLPGGSEERDISWLDCSVPADISADGRFIAFSEGGGAGGAAGGVYLWKADDSQAVRLGDGKATALSPDGHWVLAQRGESLVLLPTGAGEARPVDLAGVHIGEGTGYQLAGTFFPDGKRILIMGFEAGHGRRPFVVDLEKRSARPIGPEGAYFTSGEHIVSPDGRKVAAVGPDRRVHLYGTDEGSASDVPLPGTEHTEALRWCADGTCIFLPVDKPEGIVRLDVRTGRRERSHTLSTEGVDQTIPAADGKHYVYFYYRYRSHLVLVDGVK
jgi:WD40 repeat protein